MRKNNGHRDKIAFTPPPIFGHRNTKRSSKIVKRM